LKIPGQKYSLQKTQPASFRREGHYGWRKPKFTWRTGSLLPLFGYRS